MKEKINIKRIGIFAFIVLSLILSAAYLLSQEESHGTPLNGINENRSQVLVTGDGYTMNKDEEKEYLKEEKKREEIRKENIQKEIKETGESISESGEISETTNKEYSGGEGDFADKPGGNETGTPDDNDGEDDISKLPLIECSLENGQQVNGNALTFTVRAVSYKNVTLSSFDLNVQVNGEKLYSSGTGSKGTVTYRADGKLKDGANQVIVAATDREGYANSKTYTINVNLSGERPKEGKATLILDAPSIGLGTIYKVNADFYQGENVASFADRILKEAGFGITGTGNPAYGYYLQRIHMKGIADGYVINPTVKKHLDEINAGESAVHYSDSLGEKDFYHDSGWVYSYNGQWLDGMSAINMYDGDVIRISFSLYFGYEYNGTWTDCNL